MGLLFLVWWLYGWMEGFNPNRKSIFDFITTLFITIAYLCIGVLLGYKFSVGNSETIWRLFAISIAYCVGLLIVNSREASKEEVKQGFMFRFFQLENLLTGVIAGIVLVWILHD